MYINLSTINILKKLPVLFYLVIALFCYNIKLFKIILYTLLFYDC